MDEQSKYTWANKNKLSGSRLDNLHEAFYLFKGS